MGGGVWLCHVHFLCCWRMGGGVWFCCVHFCAVEEWGEGMVLLCPLISSLIKSWWKMKIEVRNSLPLITRESNPLPTVFEFFFQFLRRKRRNEHIGIVQDTFIFKKSARRFGETINTLAGQHVVRGVLYIWHQDILGTGRDFYGEQDVKKGKVWKGIHVTINHYWN